MTDRASGKTMEDLQNERIQEMLEQSDRDESEIGPDLHADADDNDNDSDVKDDVVPAASHSSPKLPKLTGTHQGSIRLVGWSSVQWQICDELGTPRYRGLMLSFKRPTALDPGQLGNGTWSVFGR